MVMSFGKVSWVAHVVIVQERKFLLYALCGEEELVRQVHTLFARSAQVMVVVYDFSVQEEVEGVRQEVREVKQKGEQGRTLT